MSESASRPGHRRSAWTARVWHYRGKLLGNNDRLKQRPQVAFFLQASPRFKEIECKHLALVISLNLFVAAILAA